MSKFFPLTHNKKDTQIREGFYIIMYVIASVETLSTLSGIKNKLVAFESILELYPKYQQKVLLIQYCTPGSNLKINEEISKENIALVNRINRQFPGTVIYKEGKVSVDERLALFNLAQILLITALRDGFCLLPFEFMLTKDINDSAPGAIILSEFVGCVSAMSSICHINPYNIPEIVNSIVNVIESNQGNFKDTKFKHDLGYILENNTEKWVKSLIIELKKASIKNESALFLGAIEKKLMKDNKTFNPLTTKILETPYCSAVNRLILLDSEGTILPYVHQALIKSTEIVKPSLLQLLEKLCKDERNSVYILSGKPKEVIDKWFGKVPNLGLAAEYGFYEKYPHTTEWKKNSVFKDNSWKEQTLEIFKWYKEKTDGASIEVKDCSLVWRYKEADPEFGLWQAKDMQKSLKIALAQFPSIKTILGKGFVEVKPRALEKGELVERIIHREEENMGKFDFIFCIGDDVVDEEMFTKINTVFGKPSSPRHTVERACNYFTCTVGKKPSNAQYYVNDYQDTTTILSNMSSWSMKIKKNKSQEHIDFSEIRRSPADIYTPPFIYSSSPKDHPETLDISKP